MATSRPNERRRIKWQTSTPSRLIRAVQLPAEISDAANELHAYIANDPITPNEVISIFESWAKSLDSRELDEVAGIVFLRIWLRRGTLEPIVVRELGANSLDGGWNEYGHAQCRAFPLGIVGHWPAGNIEIQPILSMTCALLGGNGVLVRIPRGLVDITRILVESWNKRTLADASRDASSWQPSSMAARIYMKPWRVPSMAQ